jgi:hypothetical protein
MKTLKLNQRGSHIIAVLLGVCVLGVIILAGVKVVGGHKVTIDSKTDAQSGKPTIAVPEGWQLFAHGSAGVQFIYPAAAGVFTGPTHDIPGFSESRVSGKMSAGYLPGVSGSFVLGAYGSVSPEITTRRFGPKVKLQGGDWVVVAPSQYDSKIYKKGDIYPEMTHTNVHGIDLYTAMSGDEGVVQYNIYFVTLGRMRVLQLPPFNSDVNSSSYNVNDQAPYDSMFAQVRDSISLY